MIQLLLIVVLITVCKAQYGEVAPPAPIPPSNYASKGPRESPHTNKPPRSESGNKQVTQPENQSSPKELPHFTQNVTCTLLVESKAAAAAAATTTTTSTTTTKATTTTKTTQSTAQQTDGQLCIPKSTNSSLPTSELPSFEQPTTTPSSNTRPLTPRTTRQTTRQLVTTQRHRITSTSKRFTLIVTKEPEASLATRNQTRKTTRTTPLPSTSATTASKRVRPIQSSDCSPSSDTLFVVDSTSSVKQFFEDHRNYVIEIIDLIFPKLDNEARIGLIEYSSPLRRQVKLPFTAHENQTKIVEIIKKLPFFAGITATGAALKLALELLQDRRSNVLTNVVVLTDGFSYDFVDEPSSMLHRLPNVRTFTATVTDSWREHELETIAGEKSRVFKGKNSTRILAEALLSCGSGLSHRRSLLKR